jgi:hypothetical protein
MGATVKQFKDDELKQLARYIGSLDGEVQTVKEAKFRIGQK